MCLYTNLIANPKYKPNKKNNFRPPKCPDERVKFVPIGCGECIECRKKKAREWQARLTEDIKENKNGRFITLTFSNDAIKRYYKEKPKEIEIGYQLDNWIATRATRLFLERWRKEEGKSIRHWLVTELGHTGTHNIHLHGIIWTSSTKTEHWADKINRIWNSGKVPNGFVWTHKLENGKKINYVNDKTVNYIVKYVNKIDHEHTNFKSQILTSPGIGKCYTEGYNWKQNIYNSNRTDETYRTPQRNRITLPIYWRNKIYSEEQRELLWIHRINKQERWVCGEKISIAKNDKDYWGTIYHYRKINEQLGYGNGTKTYIQKEQEEQLRKLNYEIRLSAPSAGSIQKGQDIYPSALSQETSDLKGRKIDTLNPKNVAFRGNGKKLKELPRFSYEKNHNPLKWLRDYETYWNKLTNVDNFTWPQAKENIYL